ncbi:MAG: LCP family protein [Actinobacteria bacterium]|nr:LCP family protein [Actinomycetota bacterium]
MELLETWRSRSREPRYVHRRRAIVGAVVALTLLGAPMLWWNAVGPERLEGLDLGAVPSPRAAAATEIPVASELDLGEHVKVFVLFSTGSTGVSREEARRLRINDLEERGGDLLTDTVLLLVTDPATRQAALVSVPRDLWLFDRGHRINETFARHGLQAFLDDIAAVTGLPVHHVVRVNFASFARLVDGIGGVALAVERPLADLYANLYVPRAGCWRFDGAAALAYARSRHTLTRSRDAWVTDRSASDLHRTGRQRQLLAAAWEQVRGPGIVGDIPDLIRAANDLTFDAALGMGDLLDLARTFSDVAAGRVESYVLPTAGRRMGRAAAQVLDQQLAAPLLDRLRSWPPGDEPASAATETAPTDPAPPDPGPTETGSTETAPTAAASSEPTPRRTPSRPVPRPSVSPRTLPEPPAGCTRGTASVLPDPLGPLLDIVRGSRPGPDERPSPMAETTEPTPEPSGTPTEAPSEGPTERDSPLVPIVPPTLPAGSEG